MRYKTEQENFWSGNFGNEYVDRNKDEQGIKNNIGFFERILKNGHEKRLEEINSMIEFGCNVGLNIKAIQHMKPSMKCACIEINQKAVEVLRSDFQEKDLEIYNQSILEYESDTKYDLVLIKGVLIHINPDELDHVYQKLYEASKKYILICEYYNPTPITVNYRGVSEKLFKRDFAGEFMDRYKDVRLVDYGFAYHRDPMYPQDDVTWFLLQK